MSKYIKIDGLTYVVTGTDRSGRRFKMTINNESIDNQNARRCERKRTNEVIILEKLAGSHR